MRKRVGGTFSARRQGDRIGAGNGGQRLGQPRDDEERRGGAPCAVELGGRGAPSGIRVVGLLYMCGEAFFDRRSWRGGTAVARVGRHDIYYAVRVCFVHARLRGCALHGHGAGNISETLRRLGVPRAGPPRWLAHVSCS